MALVALQLLYTYVPFLNELFGSEPLDGLGWIIPIAAAVAVFLAVEVFKALRSRPILNANA